MKNQSIDDRMKENYEIRNRRFLTRRTPVIIRIDGKAFHTYTRGLDKPFDAVLVQDMQLTTKYLCENIQGCRFGYCQSDEISLLLIDYETFETDAWFDYCQNKMESIAASMATAEFNRLRLIGYFEGDSNGDLLCSLVEKQKLAFFDARSFNIPKEEVCNYFVWRQQDATKNSISMLAQSLIPHKELQGKNVNEMQELCFQKGINWNDLPTTQKRGTACYKKETKKDLTGKVSIENLEKNQNNVWIADQNYGISVKCWELDSETPIFAQYRELIENLI